MIRLPCIDCGSTDFPKVTRKKKLRDGRYTKSRSKRCIICVRENERMRYDREKENGDQYENRLRLNKEWAVRNKPKIKAYQKLYECLNASDIRIRKQLYYLANKSKILARNIIWKDENRNRSKRSSTNKKHIWRGHENDRIKRSIQQSKEREQCKIF